ncbi:ABC transporter substrate-binding protein [Haloferacaceae archaeon DSL9]
MESRVGTILGRRNFIKYGGAAGVAGLAGCLTDDGNGNDTDGTTTGDTDGSSGQITIGSNHPLTGDLAFTGTRMDNAVKLAAMIKNEQGGIESLDGAELEVISGDNQGAQELGSEVAQELVDDGANVLTGCFSSPVTDAATRVAEREGVPFVISVSVANEILQQTELNYVYRPQPSAQQMAVDHASMMPMIARDNGFDVETAGLFYIDISFGQSVRDTLREQLPENGIEVVEETPIGFGETADTQVTRLRNADPDVIIATTYEAGTVELLNAMDNQDYRPPVLAGCSNEALNDRGALSDIGETANGALATNFGLNPTMDEAAEVRDRFSEEFDQTMDANVAMTYAATQVIIAGIEAAGSDDPEEINNALTEIEVTDHIAAMPPISFREDGENANALAVLFQVQDLADRVVYPEEFAETDPVF